MRRRLRGRRVKLVKELIGGGLALALGAPHHAAAAVVADERQVPMAFAPRDLVDRDLEQIAETVGVDQLVSDPLDNPADRLPIDPRQPTGRGLVGLRRQPRDEVLEIASEAGAIAREWDALDVDAVLGAAQPSQPGVDLQPPGPEIKMPPDRVVMLLVLATPRQIRALRALTTSTPQRHRDHHPARLEADLADPHPRQGKQARECALTRMSDDLQVRTI